MRDKNKLLGETVLIKCLSIIINSTLLSEEIIFDSFEESKWVEYSASYIEA